jgi:hypothetical protein
VKHAVPRRGGPTEPVREEYVQSVSNGRCRRQCLSSLLRRHFLTAALVRQRASVELIRVSVQPMGAGRARVRGHDLTSPEFFMSSVVRRFAMLSPLACSIIVACASLSAATAGAQSAEPVVVAKRPRQDQQLITRDVIIGTQYTNLYEVVQAMRPNWLRTRGANDSANADSLQVYLDNQRIGGAGELRNIPPTSVLSLRYYDPIASASRWGMNHSAGVIFVLTQK